MTQPLQLKVFPEPPLEFAYGQHQDHPIDGLTLFGPFDLKKAEKPRKIIYGVIGTHDGIQKFNDWSQIINKSTMTPSSSEKKMNKRLWPIFPGFEAAFECEWPEKPAWSHELDENELNTLSHENDPNKRAFSIVKLYVDKIKLSVEKKDDQVNAIICIVPDEVYKNCRPLSRIINGTGIKPSKKLLTDLRAGQQTLMQQNTQEIYGFSVDFRRQIKARIMKYGIPIQIIRESTLYSGEEKIYRQLTPLSDRLWNLSTAIYYKAGGKPWKLAEARDGVCYIGIAFKRTSEGEEDSTATSAAQLFLNSGDGVVFLGEEGYWYSNKDKQYHLSKKAAKTLLSGIINTYQELEGKQLKEIFLHSRSDINDAEFEGYKEACPAGVKLIGIRVRQDPELKLYRMGTLPVMRGTFLKESEKTAYLWGTGYKPRLETYDGWEVPLPLKIDIQHGEADIEQVAKDIFGLTKLNYNCSKLGDSEPVTIKYSDAVGEILISNKAAKDRRAQFKFYI